MSVITYFNTWTCKCGAHNSKRWCGLYGTKKTVRAAKMHRYRTGHKFILVTTTASWNSFGERHWTKWSSRV